MIQPPPLARRTEVMGIFFMKASPIHGATCGEEFVVLITSMRGAEVVEDCGGVDHLGGEFVLGVNWVNEEAPLVLPSAEGLLHVEPRGRVAKVEPATGGLGR